jgi:hypothetical protein
MPMAHAARNQANLSVWKIWRNRYWTRVLVIPEEGYKKKTASLLALAV